MSLVMTLCRPEIRTYHLGDDQMRYVLSYDSGLQYTVILINNIKIIYILP